jgi:hypothetical protein
VADNSHSENSIDFAEYLFQRGLAPEPKPKPEDKPPPKKPEVKRPDITPLQATIMLAQRGRKEILPKLRELLDKSPELWQHYGSLTLQAQECWIKLIAGKDLYLAESLRLHLDAMRSDLAGPRPTALERILIDRILACHVQVLYFDAHEGQHPGGQNPKLDKYRMLRQDQAHRQFLSAVRTLATVRQLAARTIQVELIHRPADTAPTPSIMPQAYGETTPTYNGPTNRIKDLTNPPPAKPVNGVNGNLNGVNGHARFNNPLEPATAE